MKIKKDHRKTVKPFVGILLILSILLSCDNNSDDGIVEEMITSPKLAYQAEGYVKIENGSGGFVANLESGDRFSRDHDKIGDVNGDGVIDFVVGARSDDDGTVDAGAVYILFMNNDGTVQSNQKI